MTPVQRDLPRHALGLDGRRQESYRNYFVTGEGSTDHPHLAGDGRGRVRDAALRLNPHRRRFRLTRAGADLALDPGESLNTVEFSPVQPQKDTTA
ncbi:hypothetical protein [Mesorhizobium sp. AA23]|uniref:hypothetical protein n=1 Tax=Mesorhizobium sp. AA23 TaxID=1854058 RepID=UPI000AB860D8|nr:hypothetical protein [Mesorhizobium sp. AA23]